MTVGLTSANGVLSLLEESQAELQVYALRQLDTLVDSFWPEIADRIGKIELLYEQEKFPQRELAALVASKVYYHLGEFDDAVEFAFGAGKLFDVAHASQSQYIDTIIGKCIDKYTQLRADGQQIDPRLQAIVERMFQKCFADQEYKQAIGIALEVYRLDVIEECIKRAGKAETEALLDYILDISMTLVANLDFRNQVLRTLVKLYKTLAEPDYTAIAQCFVWLNDPTSMADMLKVLLENKDDKHVLLAYQIAFDTYANATQEFLSKLLAHLPPATASTDDVVSKIRVVLSGELTIQLTLEFLYRNNKSDLLILKNIKNALEPRSSVYYSAVTFAHAFINAGTTSDQFLRDNMEWLARASNWTKFSATAQLGVIHRGNVANSMNLLSPYLPKEGGSVNSSVYSEGGSLYALGLIHANHGGDSLPFLKQQLRNQDEVVQHGACLGLGIAGMATDDEDLFESMKNVLFTDSAVAGEAAGLGMGLIMLGTGSTKAIEEMLQYARETQHEKIIRGLAVGIAMIMYGREEGADALIEQLLVDKDPILRYGGVFMVALAYTGTSSNKAIRKLLHVAVSDVSDDVRRAAVTSLGFVLVRTPKQVPRVVQLLSESYNPHVRYGAALALGFSCAGTGNMEALDLLEPMTKDTSDFVRQGAFIAAAMILIQSNDQNARAVTYRKLFNTVITAKHEDAMARFGAVLASGIIDAGGRNVTINLCPEGHVRRESVIGAVLFMQFWWWFPLCHALCLSFTPTAMIGLNKDLKMPKFDFLSNAKPSTYDYPAATKPPTEEKIEKVATAVLSTTAKAKARAKKAEKDTAMETEKNNSKEMAVDTPAETPKDEHPKKAEPEAAFATLGNMSRVIPAQTKVIAFKPDSRYVPVKKGAVSGIVLLQDLKPKEAAEFLDFSTPKVIAGGAADDSEPAPPEPFDYTE